MFHFVSAPAAPLLWLNMLVSGTVGQCIWAGNTLIRKCKDSAGSKLCVRGFTQPLSLFKLLLVSYPLCLVGDADGRVFSSLGSGSDVSSDGH